MVTQKMVAHVALELGVSACSVRYHIACGVDAPDGRRDRRSVMDEWQERVTAVLTRSDHPRVEVAVVYGVLRSEFGFTGSHQAVRRHMARTYPALLVRAVRSVETALGAQAQHNWFDGVYV